MFSSKLEHGELFGWGNSEYNQFELDNGNQQVNTPIHLKTAKYCGKITDIGAGGE